MKRYSHVMRAGGVLAVLAVACLLAFTGCGAKEAPPAPPAPPAAPPQAAPAPAPPAAEPAPKAPEPAPAPAPAAAAGQPAAGSVEPVTLPVLKLMPESAMLGLAIPPLNGIIDKALALAKRIAPADFNVDEEVAKAIADIAKDLNVPDAKTFADIAVAKGIQPDAPIGVFADLTPTALSAKAAFAAMAPLLEAQVAAAASQDGNKGEGDKKEGEKKEGEKAETAPPPASSDLDKALSEIKLPSIVLVFGCADPVKVEASVKDILSAPGSDIDPNKVENIDFNGVQIKCFDPAKFVYAIAEGRVFAANSLDLLKEVLPLIAAPVLVRYGTVECLAEVPDEFVLLSRFDKLAPLVKDLMPAALAMNKQTAKFANVPLPSLEKSLNALAGNDPGVVTLVWTDKKIELKSRLDNAKHPAYAELCGEAKPLRLAPMLPEATLALLSLRFNEKAKESFRDGWLNALPPEVQKDAGLAQASVFINQAVGLIGDEITFGIAAANGGVPQAFLMASLAQADQVKALIQMFAPMTPATKQGDVDISIVAVPLPIPIYIAFPGDTVMLANDLDRFKEVIAAFKANTPTNFLASQDPPMDPAAPVYGTLLLKSSLISDIVKPMAGLGGGLPPEAEMPLDKTLETVREIRVGQGLEGDWRVSRLTIQLK